MGTIQPSIHYETTNLSFLKTHALLKSRGIKNNTFFLAIYDRSIIGLNYFDEDNLTQEQKLRILKECKINPWFFLREIFRVPETGGAVHFKLDIGNLAQTYVMLNNISYITERPRQTGKHVLPLITVML